MARGREHKSPGCWLVAYKRQSASGFCVQNCSSITKLKTWEMSKQWNGCPSFIKGAVASYVRVFKRQHSCLIAIKRMELKEKKKTIGENSNHIIRQQRLDHSGTSPLISQVMYKVLLWVTQNTCHVSTTKPEVYFL